MNILFQLATDFRSFFCFFLFVHILSMDCMIYDRSLALAHRKFVHIGIQFSSYHSMFCLYLCCCSLICGHLHFPIFQLLFCFFYCRFKPSFCFFFYHRQRNEFMRNSICRIFIVNLFKVQNITNN